MEAKKLYSTVCMKIETIERLNTIKSCFQITRKRNISTNDLINLLIEKGLPLLDKKVNKMYELSYEDENQEDEQSNNPYEETKEVNDEQKEE